MPDRVGGVGSPLTRTKRATPSACRPCTGLPHLRVHSAASWPLWEQALFLASWGNLILQPADPFSRRSRPLFPLLSSFATLAKERTERTRTRTYLSCHATSFSGARARPRERVDLRGKSTQTGLELLLGRRQSGLETLPLPQTMPGPGKCCSPALQLLPRPSVPASWKCRNQEPPILTAALNKTARKAKQGLQTRPGPEAGTYSFLPLPSRC